MKRLKFLLSYLKHLAGGNIPIASCKFCGSKNIVVIEIIALDPVIKTKVTREYQYKYICMKCKASCTCSQKWQR